ncbi:MAG: 4-hydroxy-tetrahydrodipicolinate reductase [Bacteroidetes bacterium]|nr:4-hydroxy-tetrahydrodipicolinate reductase [Bacteroidota bacterium]MCY4205122.1 4-hydroxy-tetrahydrodipicolinate reductase [Bacteroidota bacterium]
MPTALKIAIAGTGRMGKAVEESALAQGHKIIERFNRNNPVTESALRCSPDVVIDFTQPEAAIPNFTHYCTTKTPAVMGTTGWYDQLPDVHDLINRCNGAVLYSSNFSLGIQIILEALKVVAPLLDRLPEFDVAVHESHHSAKLDSPSGTAISIAQTLTERIQRKHAWSDSATSPYDSTQLDVVATRLGYVFGQHRIIIDGPADHLIIEHTAKSRAGFALGAVRAAEWLQGRTGVFTMKDMLAEWLTTNRDY